ncbi:MAG TPA: hypothetical protein VMG82_29870 [Candidatus Sulfotelmatobacter sp.]|nr:hypothetical protein [Candidatus Sulfotelmatobacter sp.]
MKTRQINEWQIEETQKALAEADRREFASPKEVNRVSTKYRRRKRAFRAR